MSKFNLGDYLKPEAGVSNSDTGQEQLRYIQLDDIDPDPRNFYSLEGLDELAANIELIGLQQPLRVRPNGERWTVVSGHRRRAACLLIRDGGSHMFDRGVPCLVDYGEASSDMQELRLIYANSSTRVLSSAEQSKQAARVAELLYKLQEQGVVFPGRIRDHVAEACNLSKSKIARLHAIRNNLDSDLLPYYDSGDLTEDAAYTLSRFPLNLQEAIARELSAGKRKKLPGASVLKETLDKLDGLLKPIPCSAHAGGPDCHYGEGRVLRSVFTQYSWDICPEGQCCMTCYKGRQGCTGACREAKDRFKLEKDAEAEKAAERKAADDVKFARRRADIERRCRELKPLVDAAGLKDSDKLWDNYEAATAGQVRAWATDGAGDQTFYGDGCVNPHIIDGLRQMAKRLKVPMSVLLGEKPAETVIEDGPPRASAPAGETKALKKRQPWKKDDEEIQRNRELWARVAKRRRQVGLSVTEAYQTKPDAEQFWRDYETGKTRPEFAPHVELSMDDEELCNFADRLLCSVDFLLGRTEIPETAELFLNNLLQAELCEAGPRWNEGEPPSEGYYAVWARYSISPTRTWDPDYEILYWTGKYWTGRPGGVDSQEYEVLGWWPLPEKIEKEDKPE